MKKIILTTILMANIIVTGCGAKQAKDDAAEAQPAAQTTVETETKSYIERVDTLGLMVLYPEYSRIDLRFETPPEQSESDVILFVEAAYTGELLDTFKHSNIAGDHVASGEYHKGYRCSANTGAFVYFDGTWQFVKGDPSVALRRAAEKGGCGYGQELIIFNGTILKTERKDSGVNIFRALCELNGRLCIAESASVQSFGDFKKALKELGVTHALYCDMGNGWNYAWYRDGNRIVELHPRTHEYTTNWLTFYK